MSNWRILAVDDEPFNLDIIAEYLDDPRYDLELAVSGDQAWEMLHRAGEDPSTVPHLIILDRMMPGMNGIDLLRKLKAEPRFELIPVILQTAAAAPDQVKEGIEAGAYYYLTKPYEPETLLAIVRGALSELGQEMEETQRAATQAEALRLLMHAEFSFKTLEEAQHLANLLAMLCPIPDAAVMGLSELLVNAVEHGNLNISYDEKMHLRYSDGWEKEIERRLALPEFASRIATVSFKRSEGGFVFTIADQGVGFDWKKYLEFDPGRAFDPNGRGIALARQISFSDVAYQGCGNVVVATVPNEASQKGLP